MLKKGKLELTWVGKEERPRLEPRVLVEDPSKSYGDPTSENMLIFGDNLLALKALEQDFAGRIKCIYIDPPYNTGSAFEQYDDGMEHSLWLTLIRERMEQLRMLLSQDGSIWISLDDNESHYFKVMMDEVFGRANFVATIIWQKLFTVKNSARHFSDMHDYILVYAKDGSKWQRNLLPRSENLDSTYSNPDSDARGPWTTNAVQARNYYSLGSYEIVSPSGKSFFPPKGTFWRVSKDTFEELAADGRIWWGKSGGSIPRIKKFLSEAKQGVVPATLWFHSECGTNAEAKTEVRALFSDVSEADMFLTPKPERLIKRVLEIASNPGDWVLDSFAGSGTTGAVAHKMGRRWIMCELGEHCHTHIIPRMRKVIEGSDQGGVSQAAEWRGGGGFKYYRLAETLLVKDPELSSSRHLTYIINPRYDERLLIRSICKIEGFRYRNEGRLHGVSSENRFLHVTTNLLTQAHLDSLASDLSETQSLLVYCTRRTRKLIVPDNIEIKKIPRDLLAKCDFEEDK